MEADPRPSAGVIVIGNEVLSGKVTEANAAFLIGRLREVGVRLRRIVVIEDVPEDIAATVRGFSERYDIVCTTGGIGPTHDDLTIASVAAAFDAEVVTHPTLLTRIEAHFGDACHDGHRLFALVPEGADLVAGGPKAWPTIRMRNVYVFPGVPSLLRKKFDEVAATGSFGGTPMWLANVYLKAHESDIYEELNALVEAHSDVEIGSYPRLDDHPWTLRLTVDGTDRTAVQAAADHIEEQLEAWFVRADPAACSTPTPQ